MKTRVVRFTDRFFRDLEAIYDTISAAAGSRIALGYIDRIETYCSRFDIASERGIPRDDLLPGLRITGFEKRVTIAFIVEDSAVVFVNAYYGGQDWEARFAAET